MIKSIFFSESETTIGATGGFKGWLVLIVILYVVSIVRKP